MRALGTWHIRNQCHHGHTLGDQRIDRLANRRMIQRHNGHTINALFQFIKNFSKQRPVKHINAFHHNGNALTRHAVRGGFHFRPHAVHKFARCVRQHKPKAIFAPPRQSCRYSVWLIIQLSNSRFNFFHRAGFNPRSAIQNAVNRGHAHLRLLRHILNCNLHHEPYEPKLAATVKWLGTITKSPTPAPALARLYKPQKLWPRRRDSALPDQDRPAFAIHKLKP